jgi:hypothetical protein
MPDELNVFNENRPRLDLMDLPFQGCDFCTRARQQWTTFEEDVDCMVPLTTRTLTSESNTDA